MKRLSGLLAITCALLTALLLPWGFTDRLNLAGAVVWLFVLAVIAGIGVASATFYFFIARAPRGADVAGVTRPGASALVVGVVSTAAGLGLVLSPHYHEYYLLGWAIAEFIGVAMTGIGASLVWRSVRAKSVTR